MLRITFLGTGTSSGVPVLTCKCRVCRSADFRDKRLRTSIFVQSENTQFAIDAGPDFRQQMLRVQPTQLHGVLYTHEHKDHTAGLDDVRPFNYLSGYKTPVDLYGRPSVLQQLKCEYAYIFGENLYPGVPLVNLHEIQNSAFRIGDISILPIEVMHHKLPVYGYRMGNFTYITDANYISEEEKAKIRGTKILVLNALQREPHISHFTLDQALELAEEIGAEQTFLTHISHKLGVHFEVEKDLPSNVRLAYDGLTFQV